ncbi:MAG: Hsp20/alpha crystallin family protein [Opitutus sp.]|nr:Hsp20/alpha crystallin family protein [Opitutus sp.]
MHPIIHPPRPTSRLRRSESASSNAFRQPSYDCREQPDALKLIVYVPGVAAAGIEIEARGADLAITARKAHVVRVNWPALRLESVQRDYQLRLRLGSGFDYAAMNAEIHQGILTVTLPKRRPAAASVPERLRRVA